MTPSVRNQILEGGRDELGAVVVRDEAGSVAAQGGHVVERAHERWRPGSGRVPWPRLLGCARLVTVDPGYGEGIRRPEPGRVIRGVRAAEPNARSRSDRPRSGA